MKHLGVFHLPRGRQSADTELPDAMLRYAKFGYGAKAICMSSERLWVSGHNIGDLVGAVSIPETLGGIAEISYPFFELVPRAELNDAKMNELVGLAVHDGFLCGLWQEYYDVDGKDGGRKAFWDGKALVQLGSGRVFDTSGYLCQHEGTLYCGRSSGAGNAAVHKGPLLWEVQSTLGLTKRIDYIRGDWTPADEYTAVAITGKWVVFLVSKAFGSEESGDVWYGGPVSERGYVDPWKETKGFHAHTRSVKLLVYHWPSGDWLEDMPLLDFHESARCRGMAYDPKTQRLYIAEAWPAVQDGNTSPEEQPRIHVYQWEDEPEKPPPARSPITVTVEVDGEIYEHDFERTDP